MLNCIFRQLSPAILEGFLEGEIMRTFWYILYKYIFCFKTNKVSNKNNDKQSKVAKHCQIKEK